MSAERFLFPLADAETHDTREGLEPRHVSSEAESGVEKVLARGPGRFVMEDRVVVLDGSYGNTYADFRAFWLAIDHGATPFLLKATLADHFLVEGAALGTGDGADTTFLFSAAVLHRYVDEDTLVVRVAGAPVTAYVLSGNEQDPLVTFTAAPANLAAIEVDYEYFHLVRMRIEGLPRIRRHDEPGDPGVVEIPCSFRAVTPDGEYAEAA